MRDLGSVSIHKWISDTLVVWKEFFLMPGPNDVPPPLPYRCGTMLMRCGPEGAARVARSWDEDEDRFVGWVATHPAPRAEWLENVERLKRRRER
jgi:hypothetical protein